jgi:hypothetical protein
MSRSPLMNFSARPTVSSPHWQLGLSALFDDGKRQDRIFFARRILPSGEMRTTNQRKTNEVDRPKGERYEHSE